MYDASLLEGLTDGVAGTDSPGASGAGVAGASVGNAGASNSAGSDAIGEAGAGGDESSAGAAGDSNDPGGGGSTNGGSAGSAGSAGALGGSSNGGTAGSIGGSGGSGAGNGGNGGNGGGAGAPTTPLCPAHPLTPRASWVATASHQSTTPKNLPSALTDGASARWSSGKAQSGDEWIQIDFGASVSLRTINLQQNVDPNDYPRGYAVILSETSNNLSGAVRASGVGTNGASSFIALPKPVFGRYLLVKQTSTSLSWWSIAEVEVSCNDN